MIYSLVTLALGVISSKDLDAKLAKVSGSIAELGDIAQRYPYAAKYPDIRGQDWGEFPAVPLANTIYECKKWCTKQGNIPMLVKYKAKLKPNGNPGPPEWKKSNQLFAGACNMEKCYGCKEYSQPGHCGKCYRKGATVEPGVSPGVYKCPAEGDTTVTPEEWRTNYCHNQNCVGCPEANIHKCEGFFFE